MPSFGRALRASLAVCVACLLAAGAPQAQANVEAIYKDALSREAAIRKGLEAAGPFDGAQGRPATRPEALLTRLRTLVGAFEDLARLFPTSATSDDALWHGGLLAADAYATYGDERDRTAALRLLEVLRVRYPTSTFTKQLPPQLAKLTAPTSTALAPTASGPAPTSTGVAPTPNPDRTDQRSATAPTASPNRTNERSAIAPTTTPPRTDERSAIAPTSNGVAPTGNAIAPTAKPTRPDARSSVAPSSSVMTLKSIHREALREVLRVTLELDAEVPFHHERIDGPPRVFIDLQGTRTAPALRDAILTYADDVVRQIRVGRHAEDRTRVVLDLRDAGRYSAYSLYNPYRLVFDFERGAAPVTPPARRLPESPPPQTAAPPRVTPPPAATPTPNGRGGFSLSRQLGLGISRIVIDPGHGGRDPGAKAGDLNEADLVLDVALRLETLLVKQGVEVVLTRTRDSYVSLEERTALANRAGADLFLSIHANASSIASARGVETYVLDFAQNAAAEAIAARENAGSTQAMRNLPDILKTMALNNKLDESREFAANVQGALFDRLKTVDRNIKNLGVKQAPFMVLIGATMPSVLVEVAFLTHRQEATLLKTDRYRQQVAEALQAGITRYQDALKRNPAVASR